MTKIIGMLMALWMPLSMLAADVQYSPVTDKSKGLILQAVTEKAISVPPGAPEQSLSRFADRPPPEVPPRQQNITFYPCSQCHKYWKTNPVPHELAPVHSVGLQHGQKRFWCLTCHDDEDRDQLRTAQDGKVGFDESWRVCGQCHANRQKDWYFGAHGKRVNDWQEAPVRYNCTHCHNPHSPPFGEQKPQPKPPVRAGLEPMKRFISHNPTVWERHEIKNKEVQGD